jgi:2-polyprenyl-3-methyl-5-hydroxy-6-metoxy-1,4-benzoquinol methylase
MGCAQHTKNKAEHMTFTLSANDFHSAACPVCNAQGPFVPLAHHDRYGMGIITVACEACGLIHTNPRPTAVFLDLFYEKYYRTVYSKVAEPSLAYLEKNQIPKRMAHSADLLDRLSLLKTGMRVLDVGCSEGSFLKAIADHIGPYPAWGVEPGLKFAEFARSYAGCSVVSSLTDIPETMRFDLILVNHVLEHVHDPVAFIRLLAGRLDIAGALFIDVPDVRFYDSLADLHLAHVLHFSPSTLCRTAAAAGLHAHAIIEHAPPKHPRSIAAVIRQTAPLEPPVTKPESNFEQSCRAVRRADRPFTYGFKRLMRGIARRIGLRRSG